MKTPTLQQDSSGMESVSKTAGFLCPFYIFGTKKTIGPFLVKTGKNWRPLYPQPIYMQNPE
ncbi:hypothetical protein LHK_02951 [Laribacter hongkongensis HLHK9]|uniref:Uncharacterized protein n=1 Tax=Laribacter hongkongensis (strain HLHK9) TaxID=557598 RepID=C1D4Y8_LARHH|nr:hypothetical protein LHK_02951 [Laribacter hongkongensis HLHK9]